MPPGDNKAAREMHKRLEYSPPTFASSLTENSFVIYYTPVL